jgi:hypothetical protein
LEKLVVEPKTLGWENSWKKFQKRFRKPWSGIHSTEMFSKWFLGQTIGYGRKGDGAFIKGALCISVCQTN